MLDECSVGLTFCSEIALTRCSLPFKSRGEGAWPLTLPPGAAALLRDLHPQEQMLNKDAFWVLQ